MKVLLIAPAVVPLGLGKYGGIELMCETFARGLRDFGHVVTVAAPKGSRLPSGIDLIETVKLPEEQDREDIALNAIANWIQTKAIAKSWPFWDIFHDFTHKHLLGQRGDRGPCLFMAWHPMVFQYPMSKYNVCCASNWQRERFEALYHQKGFTDWRWVDTEFFKPGGSRNDRFLYLGGLRPQKGPDRALEFAKKLNIPLDIVGGLVPTESTGYVEFLKQEAEKGGDIKLHFNVSEEEKLRFLQTAKAFIYPVRQEEAHTLALAEAWCCGCPTLTFDRGANKEIMLDKRFVVSTDEEFMFKMGKIDEYDAEGVQKKAVRDYSLETVIPRWAGLYTQVSKGLVWA